MASRQQRQGRVDLSPRLHRIEALAGGEHRVRRLLRVLDRVRGAHRERGDEAADRLGVVLDRGAPGDQDELVVGRDAELVDRDDARVESALLEVDALDVPEAAQDRVDPAADQGGEQVEADVRPPSRPRTAGRPTEGSSPGSRSGTGSPPCRLSSPAGRRRSRCPPSAGRSARSAAGRRLRRPPARPGPCPGARRTSGS